MLSFIQLVVHLVSVVKLVSIKIVFFINEQKKNDVLYFQGNALAKAGGQQLKEAVANASKTQTLNKTSDGKNANFLQEIVINYFSSFYVVCITDAPNLLASHLIHVNSPTWNAGSQTECISDLDQATTNILTLADQKGLTSVALPSISSGK